MTIARYATVATAHRPASVPAAHVASANDEEQHSNPYNCGSEEHRDEHKIEELHRVLSKFATVRQLLELDIGPGLQAHSATQKRLLTRERNRLHHRHRAPLGAGGFE